MNVLGLFSGIGGFELGLQKSGFRIKALCEYEDHCKRVLRKNFDCPIFNDVTTLNINRGEYDLLCGGFPCQDISIAGKNAGLEGGSKSSLWKDYLRLIKQGKPKYAIIENVSALRSRGLEIVLQNLAEIGYDACYTMFDSKFFGVPQRRRRVYIIAVRDGIPEGADLLDFAGRDNRDTTHRCLIDAVEKGFSWDFTESEGERKPVTYLTRQRSDLFQQTGLSSTLAKRDYKSYTDLIVGDGFVRRVSPQERLLLQGFPSDWLDGCGLTNQQRYSCNGMTVNVVEAIGCLIREFDKNV